MTMLKVEDGRRVDPFGFEVTEADVNAFYKDMDVRHNLTEAAPDVLASLERLAGWMQTHTSPLDSNTPHDMLVEAVELIERVMEPEGTSAAKTKPKAGA